MTEPVLRGTPESELKEPSKERTMVETHKQAQVGVEVSRSKTPLEHDTNLDGQLVAARQEGRQQLPERVILRRLWRIYEMALAAADRFEQV